MESVKKLSGSIGLDKPIQDANIIWVLPKVQKISKKFLSLFDLKTKKIILKTLFY